tara:strand:- start:10 stop:384 length:375 start_codon:yes stop_codon:yes gene_type:complete
MAKKKKKAELEMEEDEFYAAEEQGILPNLNKDQLKDEITEGEHEADPLTSEGREALVENDEMEPWEAGFAEGASHEGQLSKDALTGEPLMEVDDVVEAEINGRIYRFASEENAQKFREKHEIER